MFWARIALFLALLVSPALAQTNPGFVTGAILCANTGDVACQNVTPANPLGINQAFINKLDYPTSITPLVAPLGDGANYTFQNGTRSALNIYGPQAPVGLFVYDNVRSVISVQPTMVVQNYNAFGAWIYNAVAPFTGCGLGVHGCGHAIGLESFCVNVVAGASCFGLNPGFTDSFDGTSGNSVASIMTGAEFDFDPHNTGSSVTALSFVLQGVQPAASNLISVGFTSIASQWVNGLFISDGSFANGGVAVLAGLQGVASGNSISSISHVFNVTTSAGVKHNLFLQGQMSGSGNGVLALYDFSGTPGFMSATYYGGQAAGAKLTLSGSAAAAPSGDSVQINAAGANAFDCNGTFSGFCAVSIANGLAMNARNIVQVQSLVSNSVSGYELLTGNASSTLATLIPNRASATSGVGAQASGNVSLIASGTEIIRVTSTGPAIQVIPASAGGGGLFVCVDTSGVLYKKATCP